MEKEKKNFTLKSKKEKKDNTGMENATPRQSVNCCNKGDISASPIPALACMIPEATAALFSPMIGATAPITIPKQSAPVPAGNRMPKKISKLHHPLQKGVTISPTAMKTIPHIITKAFDFFSANIPNIGCVAPYKICPTAITKLTEA